MATISQKSAAKTQLPIIQEQRKVKRKTTSSNTKVETLSFKSAEAQFRETMTEWYEEHVILLQLAADRNKKPRQHDIEPISLPTQIDTSIKLTSHEHNVLFDLGRQSQQLTRQALRRIERAAIERSRRIRDYLSKLESLEFTAQPNITKLLKHTRDLHHCSATWAGVEWNVCYGCSSVGISSSFDHVTSFEFPCHGPCLHGGQQCEILPRVTRLLSAGE